MGGQGDQIMNRKWGWGWGALIRRRRWRRWATVARTRPGGEGIETVCRLRQTNGAGPCGKEIIMGSVSVKHGLTIQKKKGGG